MLGTMLSIMPCGGGWLMLEGRCRCGAVRVWARETGRYDAPGLAFVTELEWSGPVRISSGGRWRLCELCGTTLGNESSLRVEVVPNLGPPLDALHDAAEQGDLPAVRELLLKGALVDGRWYGKTPWTLAKQAGHSEVCQFLREQGASPPRTTGPPPGSFDGHCVCGGVRFRIHSGPSSKVASATSLPLAERYLQVPPESLEVLKGTGLLADAGGPNGAQYRQCRRCHCSVSAETPDSPGIAYVPAGQLDDPQAAARVCPAGSTIRAILEARSLHEAIRHNDRVKIEALLAEGIAVYATVHRSTALQSTVRTGNLELINFLIDQGADVQKVRFVDAEIPNYSAVLQLLVDKGMSLQWPLEAEVRSGKIATVRKLLQAGADLNRHPEEVDWVMPLHWAAHNSKAMIRFVIANGAKMDVISQGGGHALGFCALWGKTGRLRTLLECGFPVDLEQGRPGDTALIAACRGGVVDCARLLLQYGADPNLAFQTWTPLMLASRHGSLSIVEMLLAHGAVVGLSDDEGRTAADYARLGQASVPENNHSYAKGKNSAGELVLFARGNTSRDPAWTLCHGAILDRLGEEGLK